MTETTWSRRQVLGVGIGFVAGCLSSESDDPDVMTMDEVRDIDPKPPTNVTAMHWVDGFDTDTLAAELDESFTLQTERTSSQAAHETRVADRLSGANAPETFLTVTGETLALYVTTTTLHSLEPEFGNERRSTVHPEIVDTVTIEGDVYAIPVCFDRLNWLLCHTDAARAADSLETLLRSRNDDAPFVLPRHPPTFLRLFALLLLAQSGPTAYRALGAGDSRVTPIRDALVTHRRVLHDASTVVADHDAVAETLTERTDSVAFLDATLVSRIGDLTAWSIVPVPGTAETFVGSALGFVFPKRSMNPQGTMAFLDTVQRDSVQAALARRSRMLPARQNSSVGEDDDYLAALDRALHETERFLPAVSSGCGLYPDRRYPVLDILDPATAPEADEMAIGDLLHDHLG